MASRVFEPNRLFVLPDTRLGRASAFSLGANMSVEGHAVRVVRIQEVVKHPNADSLSICEVDGCPVIIKTTD